MKTTIPKRVRIARFLEQRYAQRETPNYFPELFLFVVIVITATWPILSLAAALAMVR
jgi:hypothetical protein